MKRAIRGAIPALALVLVGCEYSPDRSELEEKVQMVGDGRFGTCIDESYRAGVELQMARDRLRELEEGSPSDSDLEEGLAAANRAAELRTRAEEVCALEQANEAEAERVRELEAQLAAVMQRLGEVEAAQAEMNQEILIGVTFETGSATLTREARAVLDVQADRLVRRAVPVEVAGFASTTGTEEQNIELSRRRAETVLEYLVGRGVERSLLTSRGYGTANPIASNETQGGRRANQRIELHFAK